VEEVVALLKCNG